jgi:hypothetical protein
MNTFRQSLCTLALLCLHAMASASDIVISQIAP